MLRRLRLGLYIGANSRNRNLRLFFAEHPESLKLQGVEVTAPTKERTFAIVVLDMAFGARMVTDKHWIYTAISRAKRRCYLIGLTDTLEAVKSKSLMWNRLTLFAERFEKMKEMITTETV